MVVGTIRPSLDINAWARVGLVVALALMVAGMLVPALTGWDVSVISFPPLHADWAPRVGPGTVPAVLLAVAASLWLPGWCRSAPWPWLLAGSGVVALAWMLALAAVDGRDGIGDILLTEYEYLGPAREVTDVRATLEEYVDRIPFSHPDNWPPHVAGHPPGALLFFVALVRLGLGGGFAAGLVVTLVAATVPAAVLVTLQRLGAEESGRAVGPLLVIGPAAVWMSVSADAVFAAVAAWGLAALAAATTANTSTRRLAYSIASGALLGYCVLLSYGLPLLALAVVAVLVAGGSARALPCTTVVAVLVVLTPGLVGDYWWWEAFPVLSERYWDGVAETRPASYWLWGNLAALAFSAGPLVGASVAAVAHRWATLGPKAGTLGRPFGTDPAVLLLASSALAMIAVADLSLMSKAEVERIWLPFVPWALLGLAFLDDRWRRRGLLLQAGTALVVQHLLFTGW